MDIKFIIAIVAIIPTTLGYLPYLRDIFAKKTKPHLYTWLIWMITQGTATAALLHGGGKFGSLSLIVGLFFIFTTFLLSFKYGTKDITKKDTFILILAFLAIMVWWQLDNPIAAVLMISAIDGAGYIPTIRKSFRDPWSETILFWIIMSVVILLALVSNAEYNFLTVFYLLTLFLVNTALVLVCFFRRLSIKKSQQVA